jgi:hypothetical protein
MSSDRREVKVVWESISHEPGVYKSSSPWGGKLKFTVDLILGLEDGEQYVSPQRFDLKREAVAFIAKVGEGSVPRFPTHVEYETNEAGVERVVAVITKFQFGIAS